MPWDPSWLLAGGAAGAFLGLLFLHGLWITVKHLSSSAHPLLWLAGSMVLRFSAVLGGFYLLTHYGGPLALIGALIGFSTIRLFMARRAKPTPFRGESRT